MKLVAWIISKLLLRIKNDNENDNEMLIKEIKKLQKEIRGLKENKAQKEKVIILPERNNEKILIKFFDEEIENVIIKNIRETRKELCIAVAWFTSENLINELNNLKRRGIDIRVIISDDKKNVRKINKLISVCNRLKTVVIPQTGSKKYNNLMHNKYCIIDNKKVIDGSYNWSYNASYNLEHIIVIESTSVAKMYRDSFNKIYNNPRYYKYSEIHDALG